MARINLYRDGVYREEHILMKAVIGVGRHSDNDVVLDDPTLSRFHARIERRGATYLVTDLGAPAGVSLNGHRIDGERELKSGDKLTLGRYDAVFESEMSPSSKLASAEEESPASRGGLLSPGPHPEDDETQLSEGTSPQLLLKHHDVEISRHPLVKGEALVIGRAKDCAVSVPLLGLSRRHAEVSWDGLRVRVTDLKSQNGTWVNSLRIDESQFLLHGDRLDFYEYSVELLVPGEERHSLVAPTDLVHASSTSAAADSPLMYGEGAATERPASEGPLVMTADAASPGEADASAASASGEFIFEGGADLGSAFDEASDVFGSAKASRVDDTGLTPAYDSVDPLSAWELSGTASELEGVAVPGPVTSEFHTLVGKRSWRGRWLTDGELEEALAPAGSAREGARLATLEVYHDQRLLTQMPFTAGAIRVGSDSRCELSLPGRYSVRPWHATLLRFGKVALCIRGSSQGWLSEDDEEVDQVLLRDGSQLQLGTLQLRFRCR